MDNYVILKGKEDRLLIHLDPEIDYATLKKSLTEKLKEADKFLKNANVAVEFSNRDLSESEENQLLELVKKQSNIKISYIFSQGKFPVGELGAPEGIIDEGVTKFHKGSLRSGQKLDFHGNIVVLGDVNPGSIVKAKGNIVVLGYLNGTAHAGVDKENEAFISALKMNPIQLKIGDNIARNPNQEIISSNKIKKDGDLEIAYIKDGKMHIDNFNKKTLENMIKI